MKSLILLGLIVCVVVASAKDDNKTMALKFLNQYHYVSQSRSGNHDVETAVRNFQRFAGLPETGEIDAATIRQMKKPRCGMPDVDESGRRIRRYKTTGTKWYKKQLTYFVEYGQDLSNADQDRIFARALQYWADVSGLGFWKASSASSADLKISFGGQTHGGSTESTCPNPFDGPGEVLAHAYSPPDGRAHFDEAETFTDGTASGTSLLWVATHEFGHALGLDHSDVKNAVMYPYYTGQYFQLQQDDINGIQVLYGGPISGVCADDERTNCLGLTSHCFSSNYVQENCRKSCKFC